MKSLADDGGVVPRWAKTQLFLPISPPYSGQIRARDVTRTTFHTVSEGAFSEVAQLEDSSSYAFIRHELR
jgi:hypothetical protein